MLSLEQGEIDLDTDIDAEALLFDNIVDPHFYWRSSVDPPGRVAEKMRRRARRLSCPACHELVSTSDLIGIRQFTGLRLDVDTFTGTCPFRDRRVIDSKKNVRAFPNIFRVLTLNPRCPKKVVI